MGAFVRVARAAFASARRNFLLRRRNCSGNRFSNSMKSNWFSGAGSGLGSFFGVGCPACVPAVGALFSAIGLGFLVDMTILKWLTVILLSIGLLGLYANFQKHRKMIFLIIGLTASMAVFSSRYLSESKTILYTGAAVLLVNAFLDIRHTKNCTTCCVTKRK